MDDADDMDDDPVLLAPTIPDTVLVDDLATILFEDEGVVVVVDRICNRIVYSIERNRSIGSRAFRALNFTNTFDFILPFLWLYYSHKKRFYNSSL